MGEEGRHGKWKQKSGRKLGGDMPFKRFGLWPNLDNRRDRPVTSSEQKKKSKAQKERMEASV